MNRDASPKRARKLGGFRPCCTDTVQQLLLYFALALGCDTPILEALLFPTMPLLGLCPDAPFNLLLDTIVLHFVRQFPNWNLQERKPESTRATFVNPEPKARTQVVSVESYVYKNNRVWCVEVNITRHGCLWASIQLNKGAFDVIFGAKTPLQFAHFGTQLALLLTVIGNAQNNDIRRHVHDRYYNFLMAALLWNRAIPNR